MLPALLGCLPFRPDEVRRRVEAEHQSREAGSDMSCGVRVCRGHPQWERRRRSARPGREADAPAWRRAPRHWDAGFVGQERTAVTAFIWAVDVGDVVSRVDVQDDHGRRLLGEVFLHREVLEVGADRPYAEVDVPGAGGARIEERREGFGLAYPEPKVNESPDGRPLPSEATSRKRPERFPAGL